MPEGRGGLHGRERWRGSQAILFLVFGIAGLPGAGRAWSSSRTRCCMGSVQDGLTPGGGVLAAVLGGCPLSRAGPPARCAAPRRSEMAVLGAPVPGACAAQGAAAQGAGRLTHRKALPSCDTGHARSGYEELRQAEGTSQWSCVGQAPTGGMEAGCRATWQHQTLRLVGHLCCKDQILVLVISGACWNAANVNHARHHGVQRPVRVVMGQDQVSCYTLVIVHMGLG